jgi:hypothetical protein
MLQSCIPHSGTLRKAKDTELRPALTVQNDQKCTQTVTSNSSCG